MLVSSRPVVLLGAIIATGLCLFLGLQAAALLLPFALPGRYLWILAPTPILLVALGAFLRARKRRKGEMPLH
jgi:hypothetical protein